MAIGGFVSEMLAEGVIFNWISRSWRAIFGGVGHEIVQDFIKEKIKPAGLDDENIFAYIFSVSKYKDGDKTKGKFGSKKKWDIFSETLAKMDGEDYNNKTHYLKNFRLIITIDAIGRGCIKTSIPDKNDPKKTTKIIETPDPNYIRPGISILQDMITSCSTENEFRSHILVVGAMQDAPFGTLDEITQWTKTVGFPLLHQALVNTNQGIRDTSAFVENYYQEIDNNWDRARSVSWRNPLAKIIALFRAM